METKEYIDRLTYRIIGCAIEFHKVLGPGLLENVYEKCFIHELGLKGLDVKSQCSIPVNYKGIEVDCDLRFDVTYMKLLEKPKGILLYFNCKNLFYEGQKTFVNEYYAKLL